MIAAMLMQQLLNGVVVGSVYALFALGFTLLFGVNHIMNMAHGSVFMWGAFAGLYAVTVLDAPIYVALLIGMLAGGLVSVALDLFAFRPLRRRGAMPNSCSCRSASDPASRIAVKYGLSRAIAFGLPRFGFSTAPCSATSREQRSYTI